MRVCVCVCVCVCVMRINGHICSIAQSQTHFGEQGIQSEAGMRLCAFSCNYPYSYAIHVYYSYSIPQVQAIHVYYSIPQVQACVCCTHAFIQVCVRTQKNTHTRKNLPQCANAQIQKPSLLRTLPLPHPHPLTLTHQHKSVVTWLTGAYLGRHHVGARLFLLAR